MQKVQKGSRGCTLYTNAAKRKSKRAHIVGRRQRAGILMGMHKASEAVVVNNKWNKQQRVADSQGPTGIFRKKKLRDRISEVGGKSSTRVFLLVNCPLYIAIIHYGNVLVGGGNVAKFGKNSEKQRIKYCLSKFLENFGVFAPPNFF